VRELSDIELASWAERIDHAHRAGQLLEPISNERAISLPQAYRIQRLLTARRVASGASLVGWKLGYTSAAMREQMRVDDPNFGPLTSQMLLADGASPPPALTQPRVEPEIAVRLADDLPPDCSLAQAAAAVGSAHAALEIVDSVWIDYRFTLADNTADGSSAAAVVIGPELASRDHLDRVEVNLFRNSANVGTGYGADALGHPLAALCWLARALSPQGDTVRAGDTVITGGLTRAVPLQPGDVVRATFGTDVEVSTSLPL
jgi:2-keto-4-pentenoate hydratase